MKNFYKFLPEMTSPLDTIEPASQARKDYARQQIIEIVHGAAIAEVAINNEACEPEFPLAA